VVGLINGGFSMNFTLDLILFREAMGFWLSFQKMWDFGFLLGSYEIFILFCEGLGYFIG
jgi:hypothetical protein